MLASHLYIDFETSLELFIRVLRAFCKKTNYIADTLLKRLSHIFQYKSVFLFWRKTT